MRGSVQFYYIFPDFMVHIPIANFQGRFFYRDDGVIIGLNQLQGGIMNKNIESSFSMPDPSIIGLSHHFRILFYVIIGIVGKEKWISTFHLICDGNLNLEGSRKPIHLLPNGIQSSCLPTRQLMANQHSKGIPVQPAQILYLQVKSE